MEARLTTYQNGKQGDVIGRVADAQKEQIKLHDVFERAHTCAHLVSR
jgi:hypothetical protein